jgi:hypothetical protein
MSCVVIGHDLNNSQMGCDFSPATSQLAKRGHIWNLFALFVLRYIAMDDIREVEKLVANDRCDVCGAQAYIRVQLDSGELLFCAHHGNANKEKLQPLIINWHDQTQDLSQK